MTVLDSRLAPKSTPSGLKISSTLNPRCASGRQQRVLIFAFSIDAKGVILILCVCGAPPKARTKDCEV